jgi:hypothetical protein
MSATRQLNTRFEDLPLAMATFAAYGRGRFGCVITDGKLYSVGSGDSAELDAVAKFGVDLSLSTVYVTRLPDEMVVKFFERCGLRRLVVLQTAPDGHNGGRGPLFIEYAGQPINRMRDMIRSLEASM